MLGIDTRNKTPREIAELILILPRLEAYHEWLLRSAKADLDEDRAYYLTLQVTGDSQLAEKVANQVKFSRTPLES